MSAQDPLIGATLGPCRLEALVGRGAVGRVYKARHLALDRLVAVKIIDESGADAAARREQVLTEARAAAKLEDSRIVAVHEVGSQRGIYYIVMQWVDGESLEARVARVGPLPPEQALAVIKEAAAALLSAHAAGLVHRDVKPGNILLDARGAVKLADFGLARSAGAAAAEGEAAAGSFHFMAPEQAWGGPPDPRSDLYALGATWYYALTGKPPFPGSGMDALLRHRDEEPPDVRVLSPLVTQRAGALLRRLLAKKPEERPADARSLLAELSSAGMLLDTDASGSPFKILPVAPRREAMSVSPVEAVVAPLPPPPPPPVPPPQLGSKASFFGLLAAFGVIAFGWQWLRAGPEDWAAGAAVFAALPAALTVGERRTAWRRAMSVAAALAALLCWERFCRVDAAAAPPLEAAILLGLGACALFGGVYLGQWGQDRSEAAWARVLGPLSGLCLLLSALTWTAPESQPWGAALVERGGAWRAAFTASRGGWRWLGTLGVCCALAAATRLKAPASDARPERRLNWNR